MVLKQGLLWSSLRLGQVAQILQHTHVAGETKSLAPRDVLPLPVCTPDLNEHRILRALEGGAAPRDLRRDFRESLPRAARAAWVFLLIMTLNFMNLGWSDARTLKPQLPGDLMEAQLSARQHLEGQVESTRCAGQRQRRCRT